MKRLVAILLVAWLVEMSVMSGIAASRRPVRKATVDVTPTPAPVRAEPSVPQQKCEGALCPTPTLRQPTRR